MSALNDRPTEMLMATWTTAMVTLKATFVTLSKLSLGLPPVIESALVTPERRDPPIAIPLGTCTLCVCVKSCQLIVVLEGPGPDGRRLTRWRATSPPLQVRIRLLAARAV